MTVEDIEIAVVRHFGPRVHLAIPNASWGAGVHECDLLFLTNAGYLWEVEIKRSKADLKKDGEKRHGHRSEKIRRLYFALPLTLYNRKGVEELIPAHAGVMVVSKDSYLKYAASVYKEPEENKVAQPLHIEEQFKMARLAALRIWDLKQRLQTIREALKDSAQEEEAVL